MDSEASGSLMVLNNQCPVPVEKVTEKSTGPVNGQIVACGQRSFL
jgi:hypothetical protein